MAKTSKELVTKTLTEQVAALTLMRVSEREVCEQLGTNRYQLGKIKSSPEFKDALKTASDEITGVAKAQIKDRVGRLVDKVLLAVENQLDKNSIDAVKVALKILGFEDAPPAETQTQALTVVMPGAKAPESNATTVEVKSDDYETLQ